MIADKQYDYITDNYYVTAYVDYNDSAMTVVCNECDTHHVFKHDDIKSLIDLIEIECDNPFGDWDDAQGDAVKCFCKVEISEDDLPF